MDVVEPGNESRDLIHVEAPSTPKTETDADVAPLIQKVGATSIVEIEKLMGELPRVGGLERYVQNQPTGAIVGSVHRAALRGQAEGNWGEPHRPSRPRAWFL